MRRFFSLVLLLAFTFPVVAPALTLARNPDASLPACCRRNGAHHCSMNMASMAKPSNGPSLIAVCPFFPQPSATPPLTMQSGLLSSSRPNATHMFAFSTTPRATMQSLSIRDSVHHKRGPPQYPL